MTLREIKSSAIDKFSQGDVNIYLLKKEPDLKTEKHKDNVLVVGQSGHHHRLIGKNFEIGKTTEGQFIVRVIDQDVKFAHEQHQPPIELKPGIYLFDRAREKGMYTDMIAPVQD